MYQNAQQFEYHKISSYHYKAIQVAPILSVCNLCPTLIVIEVSLHLINQYLYQEYCLLLRNNLLAAK
nr:MAG TPA: hypothetical protein [Caudoviricetes sp.]